MINFKIHIRMAEKRLSQRDGVDIARAELALRRALVRLDVAGNK